MDDDFTPSIEMWIKYYAGKFAFWFLVSCPYLAMALAGGLVRLLKFKRSKTIFSIAADLVTSAFVGLVVYLLMSDLQFRNEYKAAIVGISGYLCENLLIKLGELGEKMISKICDLKNKK